jgi:hypothetical protein
MKDRSWLVLIALGLLAVTVAACGTADEPTASPIPEPTETKPNSCNDDDCFIIPAGTRFPQSGSGSCIHFTDDTRVEPRVEEFAVNPVAEEDLPPHDYLGDVIASLEIMPDGCSFSPPIEIIFKLSPPGRYEAGKRLPVYQYV